MGSGDLLAADDTWRVVYVCTRQDASGRLLPRVYKYRMEELLSDATLQLRACVTCERVFSMRSG